MSSTDLFKWSDDYSINIEEVDEQHKELLCLIRELHVAILENQGKAGLREILNRLTQSTRTHFLLEESLMRLSHYPGLDIHKLQHRDLMAEGQALQQQLDNKNKTIDFELLKYLNKWLLQHISESDMLFSVHFQQAGLLQYAASGKQIAPTKKKWWKFW
ncbi:bacteriohemerythrin [Propionivibrio sp.]|uniref:bacteriohemerythrin n=1 Tax=Propionivibrio sp. TaxID=2212460 RepID=UPI003BF217CC